MPKQSKEQPARTKWSTKPPLHGRSTARSIAPRSFLLDEWAQKRVHNILYFYQSPLRKSEEKKWKCLVKNSDDRNGVSFQWMSRREAPSNVLSRLVRTNPNCADCGAKGESLPDCCMPPDHCRGLTLVISLPQSNGCPPRSVCSSARTARVSTRAWKAGSFPKSSLWKTCSPPRNWR